MNNAYKDGRFMACLILALVLVVMFLIPCLLGGKWYGAGWPSLIWWSCSALNLGVMLRLGHFWNNLIGSLMCMVFGPIATLTVALYGLSLQLFPRR